jgi:hypothetical protein
MKFSLRLLETDNQIAKLIMDELKIILDKAISKALPTISSQIKILVSESLRNQPEYSSLMTGTLKAELGIADATSINSVIDALIETLSVQKNAITVTNKGLSGGFVLTMMKSDDLNGVIYADIASVKDTSGYSLPWLEWLLLKGNEILVKNYEVSYFPSPYSRSGMAIMIPSSSSWRVPPQFAGTENDNWTTRAINSVEDSVYKIIQENIEKNL